MEVLPSTMKQYHMYHDYPGLYYEKEPNRAPQTLQCLFSQPGAQLLAFGTCGILQRSLQKRGAVFLELSTW